MDYWGLVAAVAAAGKVAPTSQTTGLRLSRRHGWALVGQSPCLGCSLGGLTGERSPASPFVHLWKRNLPMLIVMELAHPALQVKGKN